MLQYRRHFISCVKSCFGTEELILQYKRLLYLYNFKWRYGQIAYDVSKYGHQCKHTLNSCQDKIDYNNLIAPFETLGKCFLKHELNLNLSSMSVNLQQYSFLLGVILTEHYFFINLFLWWVQWASKKLICEKKVSYIFDLNLASTTF